MDIDHSPKSFETACRERGLKLTHQRIEVYKAIIRAKEHPSVEDIFRLVKRRIPSIAQDTVYRTVDTLAELGLVIKFTGPDGRNRFDTNLEKHQHLVCTRCHKIEDIHWVVFEALSLPKVGGWTGLEIGHVEFEGLCAECRGN